MPMPIIWTVSEACETPDIPMVTDFTEKLQSVWEFQKIVFCSIFLESSHKVYTTQVQFRVPHLEWTSDFNIFFQKNYLCQFLSHGKIINWAICKAL